MKSPFDHEKAQLYQKTLRFASWSEMLMERLTKSDPMYGRLDMAIASIVRNVHEGKNQASTSDRARFFDRARLSVLDCAGCLDALTGDKLFSEAELDEGKALLRQLLSLLVGLIHANSSNFWPRDSEDQRSRDADSQ